MAYRSQFTISLALLSLVEEISALRERILVAAPRHSPPPATELPVPPTTA